MRYIELPESEIIDLYLSNKCKMTEICEKYSVSKHKIRKILLKNNIKSKTSKKYEYNDDIFNIIDSEEKSYWLGFLYADGYVRYHKGRSPELKLKLAIVDIKHIEKFKKFISLDENVPIIYEENKKSKCYKISINSKRIVCDLINNGCVNKKSKIIKFPLLRDDLYNSFIRGFFDGDGCVFYSSDSIYISFVSGSISFLESLSLYIEKKFKCKKANLTGKSNSYKYIIYSAKDDIFKIYNNLYNDKICFLERKKEKFDYIVENYEIINNSINRKRRKKYKTKLIN